MQISNSSSISRCAAAALGNWRLSENVICLHCIYIYSCVQSTHKVSWKHSICATQLSSYCTREAINYPSGGWWLCTHLSNKKRVSLVRLLFTSLPLSISWLWELILRRRYSSCVRHRPRGTTCFYIYLMRLWHVHDGRPAAAKEAFNVKIHLIGRA